jgi:ketosteroid isomerase-like protein
VRTPLLLVCAAVAVAASVACQTPPPAPPPDRHAEAEAAIRSADEEWSRTAATLKDLDKTVAYYADDALVMPPNGTAVTSKADIRSIWKGYLDSPGFGGGWKVVRVEGAQSGELGYASGTWEFTWNDAAGKPASDRGKFTEIWKKQVDGSWKCIADIWNSDLPLPAPAEIKK